MSLFGFGKKKEVAKETVMEEKSCCCSNGTSKTIEAAKSVKKEGCSVKVLGSGCAKCNQLEAATKKALLELGLDDTIEHVTDFAQIAAYGVMTTPALVVDEKVVSYGKVLKTEEVIKILEKVRGN